MSDNLPAISKFSSEASPLHKHLNCISGIIVNEQKTYNGIGSVFVSQEFWNGMADELAYFDISSKSGLYHNIRTLEWLDLWGVRIFKHSADQTTVFVFVPNVLVRVYTLHPSVLRSEKLDTYVMYRPENENK